MAHPFVERDRPLLLFLHQLFGLQGREPLRLHDLEDPLLGCRVGGGDGDEVAARDIPRELASGLPLHIEVELQERQQPTDLALRLARLLRLLLLRVTVAVAKQGQGVGQVEGM